MQGYAVTSGGEGLVGDGLDRSTGWSRSREIGSQSHLAQPYYSAAYSGFEQQQQGSMVPDQSPRQQLGSSQGYYGASGRAPETGSSTYYQAQSYTQSQPQQLQQPTSSQARHPPSDYPYATSQVNSSTSANQYYQQTSYQTQTYGGDEYYPRNGQPSSASTFPSAVSGGAGTYNSISPPTLPLAESHHQRHTGPGRIVRTESNEMQSTPELKGSFKKDPQDMTESKRKGKGKAVAVTAVAAGAGSDDGEDDDAQEGNGKEGKASTADFIRRLWTMVSADIPRGTLCEIAADFWVCDRCKHSPWKANSEKAASSWIGVRPGIVSLSRTSIISRRISWFSISDIVISRRLCGS